MQRHKGMEIVYFNLTSTAAVEQIEESVIPYADLTLLFSGSMTYRYNGEEIILRGGDAIFFPVASSRMRMRTDNAARYASFNVIMPNDFKLYAAGHLRECVTPSAQTLTDIFVTDWNKNTEFSVEQQNTLFKYLYTHLCESAQNGQNKYVDAMKRYIYLHLSEKLTLEQISEEVHLAPEYCCTIFKRYENKTIFNYISDQRIDMAKRLFQVGQYTAKQVAERVGFADAVYFSRLFKKNTGMSPREYCTSMKIVYRG